MDIEIELENYINELNKRLKALDLNQLQEEAKIRNIPIIKEYKNGLKRVKKQQALIFEIMDLIK